MKTLKPSNSRTLTSGLKHRFRNFTSAPKRKKPNTGKTTTTRDTTRQFRRRRRRFKALARQARRKEEERLTASWHRPERANGTSARDTTTSESDADSDKAPSEGRTRDDDGAQDERFWKGLCTLGACFYFNNLNKRNFEKMPF